MTTTRTATLEALAAARAMRAAVLRHTEQRNNRDIRELPGARGHSLPMDKRKIADAANAAVAGSSRYHPWLTEHSTRDVLITWLQRCDPNGTHSDADADSSGLDRYTHADAWGAVEAMVEETT